MTPRQQAQRDGLTRYFSGSPCKHGHVAERAVRNRECCECRRLAKIEWCRNNPDLVKVIDERRAERKKAIALVWRLKNFKRIKETRRLWVARDRAAYNLMCRTKRTKRRHAVGRFTVNNIRLLFKKQHGRCLCGFNLKLGYQVDHKTPLSRGGSNWPRNLQLLCTPCNNQKGTKTQKEWLVSLKGAA